MCRWSDGRARCSVVGPFPELYLYPGDLAKLRRDPAIERDR